MANSKKLGVSDLIRGIKILKKRQKHQASEVLVAYDEMKKSVHPAYGKRYYNRMLNEWRFTTNTLKAYKKALERRKE